MTLSKMRITMSLFLIFMLDITYSQNKSNNPEEIEINKLGTKELSPSSKTYTLQENIGVEHQTGKKRKTVFVRSTLTPFEGKDISRESPSIHTDSKEEKETENGRNTVFVKATLVPFEDQDTFKEMQLQKSFPEKEEDSEKGRKTVFIEATLTPVD